MENRIPPRVPLRFFRWFCHPDLRQYIEGDLLELYEERLDQFGKGKADRRFFVDVLLLFRLDIIRPPEVKTHSNQFGMLKSYFKIAWRNLVKNKGYGLINMAGLTSGMTVTLLIGLWIWDELSYNKSYENYDRIAQVMTNDVSNGSINSTSANPWLMSEEIRANYGGDFKYVVQSTWIETRTLSYGDNKFNKTGSYFEPEVTQMLSLDMLRGTRDGLTNPHSILLSSSTAKAFFGDTDPMNQLMRVGSKTDVKVTGVYADFPDNANFRDVSFIMPWELFVISNPWLKRMDNPWSGNFTQTFVQLADHADINTASEKIKNIKLTKLQTESDRSHKPQLFLHPMNRWHLYSKFENGVNAGGRIEFVWLFGSIGVFVLLLACINFMNLSTARSAKRAKEVGIRKSVGSTRGQLVVQFFSESVVLSLAAFVLSLGAAQLILPAFNGVADKKLILLWTEPMFWLTGICFSVFTGIVAGSYPALFLSSFQPAKVLKGAFRTGSLASIPRQVLVVLQFSISITLIIGTVIVYLQIQFAKNRPIGYDRAGLVSLYMTNNEIHNHFDAVRTELMGMGAISEMSESGSPPTEVWNNNSGFNWEGKDPGLAVEFANIEVSAEYGKTVGWKFLSGRDFSPEFKSDSTAFIMNESAAKYIAFKEPIGQWMTWNGKPYHVIGVIRDMVVESPYETVRPFLFNLSREAGNVVVIKLNTARSLTESMALLESVFKKHNPAAPFEYKFVDQEYARKFSDEERIGTLASVFAGLAIFISCLGIFGLASFMAEQRAKEIGLRKVMGASIMNLWGMLSKDFVFLVIISILLATPFSYYWMNQWLQKYEYRTEIVWWVFVFSALGALVITLGTVSYQSVKAAMANPVNSLRSE